jgi:Ca2+-binding EF-hand superfamily protein
MTKEEIETIVAAFQKFDLDGNGRLDKRSLPPHPAATQ